MSTHSISTDVLVVGGGLTGSAAAIALAREGIDTVIVDSLAGTPPDRWGMTLWPSGVRVLRDLELLGEVEKAGCRLRAMKLFIERYQQWLTADLTTLTDGHFIGVTPSRLSDILTSAAERQGVSFLRSAEIVAVQLVHPRIQAVANSPTGKREINCRILVIADGAGSKLRDRIGIHAKIRRTAGQQIVTGVGGGVPFTEIRQAIGQRWFGGCVPLGPDRTWLYAAIPSDSGQTARSAIERYAELDPEARHAIEMLKDTYVITPASVRISNWTKSGCLILGDAAHGMVPHLGLGGNANLEDIPLAADMIKQTLHNNSPGYLELQQVQKHRGPRVRYLRRVSELFSYSVTSRIPGMMLLRDLNLRRIARNPRVLEKFIQELSAGDVPSFSTRAAMLMP
jgi:2-polyprenyl-6-methoxyphenol hydroxylase-like FAD-dependent oxidoreductase